MSDPPRKTSHHHGNLRTALIDAGIALLTEGGPDALTLRRCAARAGVSHAAPAHHFDGVLGLRAAIADRGFDTFRRYMADAADAGAQTPRARLKNICYGYLNFARSHPALFDLIFSVDAGSMRERNLQDSGLAAYQVLRDTCAPFVPPGTDPTIVETQVWSLIHGYTLLELSGRFTAPPLPIPPGETEKTPRLGSFDQVITLLDHIGETTART